MSKSFWGTVFGLVVAVPLVAFTPNLSVDGGYTVLNVGAINRDNVTFQNVIIGSNPPGPYSLTTSGLYGGWYLEADGSVPIWHALKADLKIQYIQTQTATQRFTFDFSGGPYIFNQDEQLDLLPVLLGLSADYPLGPFCLTGGLSGGYGFAHLAGDTTNQNMGFAHLPATGTHNGDGGGFVAEASVKATVQVASGVSLGLQGGYRMANLGELHNGDRAWAGVDGSAPTFDLSGWNVGGSLDVDMDKIESLTVGTDAQAQPRYLEWDGGYTSLNVRGLNQGYDSIQALIGGAPFPVDFSSQKIMNGYYVELAGVLPSDTWHPGLKVQYVQSGIGRYKLAFNPGGGLQTIEQSDQVFLLPVMLGVESGSLRLGSLGLRSSLYAGYAFAGVVEHVAASSGGFTKANGVYQAGGGGFVAEAALKADYHLNPRWDLNLQGAYRLADAGYLYDSGNQVFQGPVGGKVDFDMSGVNLGGGVSYAF